MLAGKDGSADAQDDGGGHEDQFDLFHTNRF
jgi:hypothetical protein